MFKNAKQQIDILIHDLIRKGSLTEREIQIGRDCYIIGMRGREKEILNNRKLFEEKDDDEKRQRGNMNAIRNCGSMAFHKKWMEKS